MVRVRSRSNHGSGARPNLAYKPKPATRLILQREALADFSPKKIIKATSDRHVPDTDQYREHLPFEKGEYFFVAGQNSGPKWYEAYNPNKGIRGLVPVSFFDVIYERGIHNMKPNSCSLDIGQGTTCIDSNLSILQSGSVAITVSQASSDVTIDGTRSGHNPVYGIVLYDFIPERADELQVNQGDHIVIVAQSNEEWIVATPIDKEGWPGLVPITFVRIWDSTTGEYADDLLEAIKRARIPSVQEWKQKTAEYRNSTISRSETSSENTHWQRESDICPIYLTNNTRPEQLPSFSGDSRFINENRSNDTFYTPLSQRKEEPISCPSDAQVFDCFQQDDKFHFIVEALMQNGQTWRLQRTHEDFNSLQTNLIKQSSKVAVKRGNIPKTSLKMLDLAVAISEEVTSEHRRYLTSYLQQLLQNHQPIATKHVVRDFFHPRKGDARVNPSGYLGHELDDSIPRRIQETSSEKLNCYKDFQQQSQPPLQSQQQQQTQIRRQQQQKSLHPPNNPQSQNFYENRHRLPSELSVLYEDDTSTPSHHKAGRLRSKSADSTICKVQSYIGENNRLRPREEKIKVRLEKLDCVVVIKLPFSYNYSDLVQELRKRWNLTRGINKSSPQEIYFHIQYQDKDPNKNYDIFGDEELSSVRAKHPRLTLSVKPVSEFFF